MNIESALVLIQKIVRRLKPNGRLFITKTIDIPLIEKLQKHYDDLILVQNTPEGVMLIQTTDLDKTTGVIITKSYKTDRKLLK